MLTEIKKGQTGHGLLVENDGFISIDYKDNKKLCEAIDETSTDLVKLPRPFVVSAVFQKHSIENANGRIYPEDILKREVAKYQKVIEERRAYGECNHPDGSCIDLGRLAMNIIELHWEGKTLVGKIEIPITEGYRKFGMISCMADMVAHWIVSGLKIGVSSRALGSVQQVGGVLMVGDDLELVCWDVVSQPSTPNAWISTNEHDLRPYIESTEKVGTIISESNEKFKKFNEWLDK